MKTIATVLLFFFVMTASAQVWRGEYCSCKEADKLINRPDYYQDTLYATYVESSETITISVFNTTKDTLYIFNSYLQPQFLSSKYLHRIDRRNKIYKVSFLPIITYVFTKYGDVISAPEEAVAGDHQIVYNFYKLPPNSIQKIELKSRDLFKNRNESNNASEDYEVKKLNKNSTPSPRFCTTSKLKGKYNFEFEFAVYKSVNLLCNPTAYYLHEYEFDKQSKEFKVITVPMQPSPLNKK